MILWNGLKGCTIITLIDLRVACLNTGRNFIGIELDKDYFNIAKNRIAEVQKGVINDSIK